jgi:hypothetical protein
MRCKFVEASDMAHIAERSDVATRTQWSQHKLRNAFNCIVLADPVRGIFGAMPVETMYAFRKGAVENVAKLVLSKVPASKKAAFDNLAIAFHRSHLQTFCKANPKTSWSNGVSKRSHRQGYDQAGCRKAFHHLVEAFPSTTKCSWVVAQVCPTTPNPYKLQKHLKEM